MCKVCSILFQLLFFLSVRVVHLAPFDVTDFMLETTDNQQNKIGNFVLSTNGRHDDKPNESDALSNDDRSCEGNSVFYDSLKSHESNVTWSWTVRGNGQSLAQNSVSFR